MLEERKRLTQRIHPGAYYTDGMRLAEITRVYELGYIQMQDSASGDHIGFGIDAFRRRWWIAR